MDHSLSSRGTKRGASSKPRSGTGWCRRSPWAGVLLAGIAIGCGGVSPRPDAIAAELPVAADLSESARTAVVRDTEAAVRAALDGDFERARSLAASVLDRDPAVARAVAALARCRVAEAVAEAPPSLEALRRAEGELMLAERLAPEDPLPLRWRAECLELDGHGSAAAEAAEAAVERSPGDASLRWLAGRLRFELGEPRAALEQLEALVRLAPDHADAWIRIAQCHERIAVGARARKLPKLADTAATAAVRAFGRYRDLRPTDPDGPLGEAHARSLVAAGSEAGQAAARIRILSLLRVAATLGPSQPAPRHGLGVMTESEDPQLAEGHYRAALGLDPYYVPSLLNLTALLRASDRSDAARGYAWRALRAHRSATAAASDLDAQPMESSPLVRPSTLLSSDERRALQAFLASGETSAEALRRP